MIFKFNENVFFQIWNCLKQFLSFWKHKCIWHFPHLSDMSIEHWRRKQRFPFSSTSGQWCVPSYLTSTIASIPLYLTIAIGFATIGFLPTIGVGKRLLFIGQPGAWIGAFPTSSKPSVTPFWNWIRITVFLLVTVGPYKSAAPLGINIEISTSL